MDQSSAVEQELDRKRHEVTAEFGTTALRDIPLQELLDTAVRCLRLGVDARYVKILEYRPETDDLLLRAGVGWREGVVGQARLSCDLHSPPGRAFRTGEPIRIRDIRNQDVYEWAPLLREHGIVSLINVPIMNDDFIYGVLEVDATRPHDWSDADTHFLFSFAHLLTAAIKRRKAEEQRELLFRELQHRVKNNLQLIVSLLNVHARSATDRQARRNFEELAHRVGVVGSVYQMLATSRRIDRVSIRAYLSELCAKLELLAPNDRPIHIEGTFEDEAVLVDDAVPIGLIVNELVTNSVEHAFDERGGLVRVGLSFGPDRLAGTLSVSDDGHGIAPGTPRHLGLQIVHLLAGQLSGSVTQRDQARGTCFVITFRLTAKARLEVPPGPPVGARRQ